MIRQLFPPLVALALATAAFMPTTRAAEPEPVAPIAVPAEQPVTIDIVEGMLKALQGRAAIVGRAKDGTAFVQLHHYRAFFIRVHPNGQVRISKATPKDVRAFAETNGWRI